jgi:two-component system, OmpR family, response regulator MprA
MNCPYELDEPKLRIPKRKRRCSWQEYQVQSEGKYGSQDCLIIASYRYAKFSLAKEQYEGSSARGGTLPDVHLHLDEASVTALLTTGGRPMKAHILVVDDDPRITELLRRVLAYEGYSVAIAASGSEALDRALERPPDLVVLDIMLPGMDGLEVARRMRAAGDMVPILMLTARDAISDRVEGLETGADDYLVKPFAPEELVARVKALLRRSQEERQEVLRYADVELDTGTRVAHRGAREIELSPTEYELLALFLRRPRQVLTREIILDRVWGMDFEGSSNVMEVYIGYLRAKLEAEGEPRLIHTVRGVGYVFKE